MELIETEWDMYSQAGAPSELDTYCDIAAKSRWGAYITEIERRTLMKAHELAGEPTAALEIGCEGGRWTRLLTDLGWDMTCTDVNPATLAVCRQKVPTARCVLVSPDDTTLPCESKSVRLLVCIEVPAVMSADWFPAEADRVLADQGVLVGIFFNRSSVRGQMAHLKARITGGFDSFPCSYSRWKKQMCRRGFSLVTEQGFCWFFFGRTSDSRWIPPFVHAERSLGLQRLATLSPWVAFIMRRG